MSSCTTGQLLRRALAAAGVGAMYGSPLPEFDVVPVGDNDVAILLAQAHRAVHGTPAVAHGGGGTIVVPGASPVDVSGTDVAPAQVRVVGQEDLEALAPVVAQALRGTGALFRVEADLTAPCTDRGVQLPAAPPDWPAVEDLLASVPVRGEVVVLAGPEVVRTSAVGGLRALAATGRLGVLNTWGAKGVFHWQSRHHWATVGLQERDFELGGLDSADLVLATGIDEREAPGAFWAEKRHLVVPPDALAPLAERWPQGSTFPAMPPLRERLAAVTQAGWASAGSPLTPTRVTRHYAQALGNGGLVAADAGIAGYWVARTFATTRLGSASIPSAPVPGWAAACALVARLATPLRPALAVVDGPLSAATTAVVEEASRLAVLIGVEEWTPDGVAPGPEEHLSRLEGLAALGGMATLRTDSRQLQEMLDVAGPIRAWTDEKP